MIGPRNTRQTCDLFCSSAWRKNTFGMDLKLLSHVDKTDQEEAKRELKRNKQNKAQQRGRKSDLNHLVMVISHLINIGYNVKFY